MGQDLHSFGVAAGLDVLIFFAAITAFNFLRRGNLSKKFFAPKRYIRDGDYDRPRRLPGGLCWGWVSPLFAYTEDDITRIAGYDAATYLRVFSFGLKLFAILTLWGLVTVLPTNISGDQVDILVGLQARNLTDAELSRLDEADRIALENLNSTVADFESQESTKYSFTDFDKLSMANIKAGSDKLWVHAISLYVVTFTTLKLLASYHRKAVDQRIEYLSTTAKGADSHTVFVTDVPGVRFGSILDRVMASPLFKYLPKRTRQTIETTVEKMFTMATEGLSAVGGMGSSISRHVASGNMPNIVAIGNLSKQVTNFGVSSVNLIGSKFRKSDQQSIDLGAVAGGGNADSNSVDSTNSDDYVDALENATPPVLLSRRAKANEVTDMDPQSWARERLTAGVSVENMVDFQFREVYSEETVVCSAVVNDTTCLEGPYREYENTLMKLEDLVDEYTRRVKCRKHIKRKNVKIIPVAVGQWAQEKYGAKPTTVDSLSFLISKLEHLEGQIKELQIQCSGKCTASAFVTFKTRFAQVVAATSLHHHFENFWHAEAAPHPDEVIWENLKWRSWERSSRKILVWSAFAMLCLFFMIPIAFIQALIEIDRLEKYPVIGSIVTFPLVKGFLQGIMPNLVLKLFLAVLPKLLMFMNMKQGLYSQSSLDLETTQKYFIFQVITIFFFSFMTRTFLNQSKQVVEDPGSIIDVLGSAAPQTASFFINYVLVKGLVENSFQFLRIPKLAIFWFLSKFVGSERAKNRLWQNQTMCYGEFVPHHTLVILLGLVFSTVNPLILPVATLYFFVNMLYWRYDMLYVYKPSYQSGGKLWIEVFDHVLAGLFIMQLMMIGMMSLKKFGYAPFMLPLPAFTIIFKVIMNANYKRPLSVLSLRAAHDLDLRDAEIEQQESVPSLETRAEEKIEACAVKETQYVNPCMKIDWSELHAALARARKVDRVLLGSDRFGSSDDEYDNQV
ncbi:hypothetical protein BSKO_08888 [Bryopsis sp. KO-2023]|nr:hypothetical protein BSKO_08888 [Bryopsis sp. KO-2023]